MRILLVMDPYIRTPPEYYGGIERVVASLASELMNRRNDVTLWAAPGSTAPGKLESFGHEGEWTRWSNVRNVATLTAKFWRNPDRFDVVHNFGRLAYLTGILPARTPKVQTYMRTVTPANIRRTQQLRARNLYFTAVSGAIRDTGSSGGGDWTVIYNCAPSDQYSLNRNVDPSTAPLVFLGRLERCKGAHTAIGVARATGRKLVIAGNISNLSHERTYYHDEIEPHIDGDQIRYVGVVNDEQKNALLGTAAALLVPIEWEEPFPVILPESLLCGTPVVAFRRGGVPEGIEQGRTGFLCDTADEMADAVRRLGEIDRGECRYVAERRFSEQVIVDRYSELYSRAQKSAI